MVNNVINKKWVKGGQVIVDNLTGTAFTGESGAHTFRISGVDAHQAAVDITGTITAKFLAANNVQVPLTGALEDGAAVVTLTEACYQIPGRYVLSIFATNDGTTLCIYCGVGNVFCTSSDTVQYPSAALPDLNQLMLDVQELIGEIPTDYSELRGDVSDLKSAMTAAQSDISGVQSSLSTVQSGLSSVQSHFKTAGRFVTDSSNTVNSNYATAEGSGTQALAEYSHAEGWNTTCKKTTAMAAHAEGYNTNANGSYSHAEGLDTVATGIAAHAEGKGTQTGAQYAHAEGQSTTASGAVSHAEGSYTTASGNVSHAEGDRTTANHAYQHVFGTYNIPDDSTAAATAKGNYIEIVGNGTSSSDQSNARTLDWSGNEKLAGSLTLGMGTTDEVTITAAQLKQLLALLNT